MKCTENPSLGYARDFSRREFLAGSVGAAALGMLGWPQPVEEIDTMKPTLVYEVPRAA